MKYFSMLKKFACKPAFSWLPRNPSFFVVVTFSPIFFFGFSPNVLADYTVPAVSTHACQKVFGGERYYRLSADSALKEFGLSVVNSGAWNSHPNPYYHTSTFNTWAFLADQSGNLYCEAGNDQPRDSSPPYNGISGTYYKNKMCYYHEDGTSRKVTVGSLTSFVREGVTHNSCLVTSAKPFNKDPACMSCSSPAAGNPIIIGTGVKRSDEIDYQSTELIFKRFYSSSGDAFNRTIGAKWKHNFDRRIDFVDSTAAMVSRHDGRQLLFSENVATGVWMPDADVSEQLTRISGGGGITLGWRLINPLESTVEEYDAGGKLTRITSNRGVIQTLIYDVHGHLISVTDSFRRSLTFSYDSEGRIGTMTAPDGGNYTYGYSNISDLVSVTYPDNKVRAYIYSEGINTSGTNAPNLLTGIVDENGSRLSTYKYDASGRAISTEHVGGVRKTTLGYTTDSNNNITASTVTDAFNTMRTYSFSNVLGVAKSTGVSESCLFGCGAASATTYDANGNISSKTDFNGNITNYVYDLTRNLETSRTEAFGTPKARTVGTTWHSTYRLPTLITEPGRTTSFSYDTNGNLLSKTITDTALSQSRTWAYTYNSLGQVLTIDGPRTDVSDITTYTYYASTSAGNYTTGDLATITDALGHVTSITKYDANGKPISITDGNGVVTTLTYSPRGWLTSKTVNGVQTTMYEYDGVGQLTKVIQPDSSYLSYVYDAAHRLTDITDNSGNKIHYTLDAMGNRTKEETFDPSNALKQSRSRVYDSLNRLQKDVGGTNPTTQIAQYTYDNNGNLKTTTDPLNGVTTNNYDPLERLVQITNPASGVSQQGYDALDQQTSVTDPRSVITNYTPNALGDVTQTQSPDSGTVNAVYDAAGNITQKTDARGVVANYAYDAPNRLTSITYPANTAENVSFTYDSTASGNKGVGRLTGYSNDGATTTLKYDAYGNVIEQADLIGSQIYTTSYQYNNANRVSQIVYPSGRVVEYTRNSLGQISQVQMRDNSASPLTTLASGVTYEPFGPIKGLTFGNGVTTSFTHDADYRVSRITTSSIPVWDFVYTYDAAGSIKNITDQVSTFSKTLDYDVLYRLITDTNNTGAWTYQYDANDNRTQRTNGSTQTLTYPSTSNRMSLNGGVSQTLDAAGNLTANGTKGYTYNQANRLKTFSLSGVQSLEAKYSATGQRTQKLLPDNTSTHFHYDLGQHYLATTAYSASGVASQRVEWVYLDDLPIAQVTSRYDPSGLLLGSDTAFIHVDHLNTPRLMTNASQAMVWRWDGDAFGQAAPNNNPDGDGVTETTNLRFPGQIYDAETGLYYNINRDYDPSTGRYIESDPIGLEGGLNTFGYVGGNPVSKVDPLGLFPGCYQNSDGSWRCPSGGPTYNNGDNAAFPSTYNNAKYNSCYSSCMNNPSTNHNVSMICGAASTMVEQRAGFVAGAAVGVVCEQAANHAHCQKECTNECAN